MIDAIAGTNVLAYAEDAPSGLVGTLGYTVKDAHDATTLARSTAGVVELVTGSGRVSSLAPKRSGARTPPAWTTTQGSSARRR